jgi:hypothetical protein
MALSYDDYILKNKKWDNIFICGHTHSGDIEGVGFSTSGAGVLCLWHK